MDFINTINWENVLYAIFTLLAASGVTFSWLKKMCQKIESTNLRVEEHRDGHNRHTAGMRKVARSRQHTPSTETIKQARMASPHRDFPGSPSFWAVLVGRGSVRVG